jgi:hypothetical protein
VVKTPSKFLSIEFLRELQRNYYLSPCGLEYCAEEVDALLIKKLSMQVEGTDLCQYMSRQLS